MGEEDEKRETNWIETAHNNNNEKRTNVCDQMSDDDVDEFSMFVLIKTWEKVKRH